MEIMRAAEAAGQNVDDAVMSALAPAAQPPQAASTSMPVPSASRAVAQEVARA
jgi:glutamate synthase (NADPH/NADH) large chain